MQKVSQMDFFESSETPVSKAQKALNGLYARYDKMKNAMEKFKTDILEVDALIESLEDDLLEKMP